MHCSRIPTTHSFIFLELKKQLRKRFYIADGNFTELHALWQYEEQYLVKSQEFEVRRFLYWNLLNLVLNNSELLLLESFMQWLPASFKTLEAIIPSTNCWLLR